MSQSIRVLWEGFRRLHLPQTAIDLRMFFSFIESDIMKVKIDPDGFRTEYIMTDEMPPII